MISPLVAVASALVLGFVAWLYNDDADRLTLATPITCAQVFFLTVFGGMEGWVPYVAAIGISAGLTAYAAITGQSDLHRRIACLSGIATMLHIAGFIAWLAYFDPLPYTLATFVIWAMQSVSLIVTRTEHAARTNAT